jgi:hypothetical protein
MSNLDEKEVNLEQMLHQFYTYSRRALRIKVPLIQTNTNFYSDNTEKSRLSLAPSYIDKNISEFNRESKEIHP